MKEKIKEIQQILKDAGFYTGIVDGIIGDKTVNAVKQACGNKVEEIKHEQEFSAALEKYISRLNGVNTNLCNVVKKASLITKQPFIITEGLRTKERQVELVKQGKSKTMNSNHITGKAVDLAPLVNGKVSWDIKYFYEIAEAMRKACKELKVRIRWGGCWEYLNDSNIDCKTMVENYSKAKKAKKQTPFIDCPHFEV